MTGTSDTEADGNLALYLGAAAHGNRRLLSALHGWRREMPDELLRAALLPSHEAICRDRLFINPHSVAHRQLIPHLHYSLGTQLVSHHLEPAMRQSRLRNAIINQKLFIERAEILASLGKVGLDALVFKGADFAFSVYPDPCCRVVGDIDLLIDENDFERAIDVLRADGWVNTHGTALPPREYIKRSLALSHPDFVASIDIQNHACHHAIWTGADNNHFSRAVSREVSNGIRYRALCPEHALLQVCAHGVAQNFHPPVRWAADAAWILRSAGESFDWDVLLAAMRSSRSGPIVSVSLAYLHLILEMNIPSQVLREARQSNPGRAFRNAWRYRLVSPQGTLQRASAFLSQFHEAAPDDRPLRMLGRLPAYIRNSQRATTTLQGLGSLGRKALGWRD